MVSAEQLVVAGLVGGSFLASLSLWWLGWCRGWPAVSPPTGAEFRLAPWGLRDLLAALVGWLILTLIADRLVRQVAGIGFELSLVEMPGRYQGVMIAVGSATTLLASGLTIAWLVGWYRTASLELGWDTERWPTDLMLGGVWFLRLAPWVYLLQWLLTQFFPSDHPLVEVLRSYPSTGNLMGVALAAVLVAPWCEELLFRVLLQGWLDRLLRGIAPSDAILVWGGRISARPNSGRLERAVPIAGSAAAFSVAHLSHGPDFVPLFVLAVGLGWLYQQTGRILPCIVVHTLLNLVSVTGLVLQVWN